MEPSRETFSGPFSLSSPVSKPGFAAPWHWHEINEIYICETDRMNYMVGNILYEIQKGDILLLNALDIHRALPPEHEDYARKIILFHDDFLRGWKSEGYDLFACFRHRSPDFCHHRHLNPGEYESILKYYSAAQRALQSDHPAALIRQKMILTELLILLNDIYAVPARRDMKTFSSSEEDFIRRVLLFIEEGIKNDISLDLLSREFGISVNSLNSKFRKVTRMTVHQFIIHRRLQLACALLKQGSTVSDAAYDSGFGDLSHFIRCFKTNIGTTPGNYARSNSLQNYSWT
ncbi:MAG: AraC family transcriptional regulator [Spirochaetales bacterium]|nr:AraC family transcriptional regulator [Spirochaetales bacterium]